MNRPVLLGGERGLQTSSWILTVVAIWLPVMLCLCVIGGESTDTFSSAHTSGWLRHLAERILGPIAQTTWELAHHRIRKTGHFVGYGLVGLSWLRAWLLAWQPTLRRRGSAVWRWLSVAMALLFTLLSASVDELHQTFVPSRTGMISDAWLDTAGAAAAMLLVSIFWPRRSGAVYDVARVHRS